MLAALSLPLNALIAALKASLVAFNSSSETAYLARSLFALYTYANEEIGEKILEKEIGFYVSYDTEYGRVLIYNFKNLITYSASFVFSSVAEIFEAETFAFQYCDEDIRAGVYSYSVQLASNSFIGVAAGLTVTNGTLTGLAVPR